MAQILGPDGQPVRRRLLTEEIAGPTVTGIRQTVSSHPAQGLTPGRLAALLREAEDGDATRYLELAEEMEEKDLHYRSVLGTRKLQVSQLDITVEPASDSAEDETNAELVRDFLKRDELQDELCDILDAVGKGFSVTEIIWETSERQWMPARLEWRFPQWFEFDRNDGRTLLLKTENVAREPLAPFKFIRHFHKSKAGLPIRGGLGRAAAWGYLFKNYDLKDWVTFIEVYGQPVRVGKYHAGATPEDKATLLRAVRNIGTDAAAIIPENMMLEFVRSEASRETGELYKGFADYIDAQISKAVLGQTLTTEVSEGSKAAAVVHDNVRSDIERSDATQLGATLSRDLARPIVDLNRGPQQAYPRVKVGRPEQVDVKLLSDSLGVLVPLGLKVGQEEVRRKIGVSDPDADSELLGVPQPPAGQPQPGQEVGPDQAGRVAATASSAAAHRCPGCGVAINQAEAEIDDSMEELIDEVLSDEGWEPLVRPMVEQLLELAQDAESLEDLRERLAEVIGPDDVADFNERLAQVLFAGRLAGETGAPTTD